MYLASFYDECRYFAITIFLNSPLIGVSFCKQWWYADTPQSIIVSVPLSGLAFANDSRHIVTTKSIPLTVYISYIILFL